MQKPVFSIPLLEQVLRQHVVSREQCINEKPERKTRMSEHTGFAFGAGYAYAPTYH